MQQNFLKKYKKEGIFIIAEIGVNHNGKIDYALQLIDIAKKYGADAVKFQTFNTDKLVNKNTPMAEYQKNNLKEENKSQYDMIKKLELTKREFLILKNYCDKINIIFISTPFDIESVDLLEEVQVPFYKVGSGDCDNFLLLNKLMKTNKPMIISLGMSDMDDINKIKNFVDMNNYKGKYIFLHCVSAYPTQYEDVNISCVKTISEKFNVPVGFSDHTIDSTAGILSVGYSAVCIEKHITLDNDMYGPDHKASLNPESFKLFVKNIRDAEKILGDGNKICTENEKNTKLVAKKKLIYNCDLNIGDIIQYDNLDTIRLVDGITPDNYFDFVGKKLIKNIKKNDIMSYCDIVKYEKILYCVKENVSENMDITEEIYYYLFNNKIIKNNTSINDIIGFDPYVNKKKNILLFSENNTMKIICENMENEILNIMEFNTDKLNNLFKIGEKTCGFIMLRHVNDKNTDRYWKKSYESIRKFYGNIKIVIIDDNSNYDFVDKDYEKKMVNVNIINSEYHKRGELLPYYYFLKYKFFDIACIIHDSVFANKHINFYTKDYIILWCAEHNHDNAVEEKNILKIFNDKNIINFYDDKKKWKVCFGGMTIINYDFLFEVNKKYDFGKLLNLMTSRKERMCFERIIACLLGINTISKKYLLGDIFKYCKWGITYDEYVNNMKNFDNLPFIKIWTGR
jgi:N,N'-diacetyllegionaminate synthase